MDPGQRLCGGGGGGSGGERIKRGLAMLAPAGAAVGEVVVRGWEMRGLGVGIWWMGRVGEVMAGADELFEQWCEQSRRVGLEYDAAAAAVEMGE